MQSTGCAEPSESLQEKQALAPISQESPVLQRTISYVGDFNTKEFLVGVTMEAEK